MLEVLVVVVLSLSVLALFFRVKSLEASVARLVAGKQNPMFTPAPANHGPSAVSAAAAAAASARPAFVPPAAVAASVASSASPNVIPQAEVEALIREGQLIGAIKLWRQATGIGLKDAKDAVEALRDEMKRRG